MKKKMLAMIQSFLRLEKFAEKDGKVVLTEEQRAKVEGTFGKEFTEKFVDYLANGDEDDKKSQEMLADLITGLISAQSSSASSLEASFKEQLKKLKTESDQVIAGLKADIDKLSADPEEDPEPEIDAEIPRHAQKPTVMKVDMRKPVYEAVGHFLKTGRMKDVEAQTIDVADLATEFGTYLSQGRNNLDEVKAIFQGFSSAMMFTSKMAITEWRAFQALITSISQQFTPKWTPLGKTQFRPLSIRNRRHKINCPIIPAEVLESYMLFMYDEGMAPDQMPITKYIWNMLIYPQLMQDIELRMIWKGKYVEKDWDTVSNGDAGDAPENSMDGIETILVDNKAANAKKINYFPEANDFDYTTATAAEILQFTQNFVDWIAPVFRTQAMNIACSDEFYKAYKRAYKQTWGPGSDKSDQPNFGSDNIDFSLQTLKKVDGMYGSPILFATPMMNLIKLRHKNEVPRVINDVQKQDYEVRLFGEYWLGAGFAYGEAVFAAVPDGYNPKAKITEIYDAHTTYQQNKGTVPASGSGSGAGGL